MQYEFNDGRASGGKTPRLYLARGGEAVKFVGRDIPGYCVIAASLREKAGKWSNTSYLLDLATGVRPLYFLSPLHGTWGDELQTWGEVLARLGLPIEQARAIVEAEYPETAKRLDRVEAFHLEQDGRASSAEVVVVAFGSPTNRQIAEGYWDAPKEAATSGGRKVVVAPSDRGGWGVPTVLEPDGATIISSRHTPGMHGGYWTVEVAVPEATR